MSDAPESGNLAEVLRNVADYLEWGEMTAETAVCAIREVADALERAAAGGGK